MKVRWILVLVVLFFVVAFGVNFSIIGDIIGGPKIEGNFGGPMVDGGFGGPTAEDVECLRSCVVGENRSEDECMSECGVEPESEGEGEEEVCMQECISRGCEDKYDFACERANVGFCEEKCGMKGDAPDESEMNKEQKCISDCVNAINPSIICKSGSAEGEGEQGGEVCQRCADECVYLYDGPCLTDEKWREKEEECMALGKHMEAAPVRGDSGEGYECTVDIECIDRSDEWGDEPGEGPGIGDEGYVAPNFVMGVIDKVVGFFKGLF